MNHFCLKWYQNNSYWQWTINVLLCLEHPCLTSAKWIISKTAKATCSIGNTRKIQTSKKLIFWCMPLHLQEELGFIFSVPLLRSKTSPWLPSLLKDYLASQCLFAHHTSDLWPSWWLSAALASEYQCFSFVGKPKLDIVLQMCFHECWVEENNHFCQPGWQKQSWLNSSLYGPGCGWPLIQGTVTTPVQLLRWGFHVFFQQSC